MSMCFDVTRRTEVIEGDEVISYGISADYNGVALSFNDIALNRDKVIYLRDFLERNDISLVHFRDVIEDFLAE